MNEFSLLYLINWEDHKLCDIFNVNLKHTGFQGGYRRWLNVINAEKK